MKYIKRIFRVYSPFTRSIIQSKMSYKLEFFMSIVGQLVKCFVIYYLWKAVYVNSKSATINGFTVSQMITYVFISTITANMISNTVDVSIGDEVWEGSIAMNLIKPINYQIKLFFESFAELIHGSLFVALPIWIGFIIVRYVSVSEVLPSITTIILYLISSFLGFLILFLLNFSFGILSFYVTNIWGIRNLKYAFLDFLSGAIVPISFFPLYLQKAMKFVPFGSINYVPVTIYLGKVTGNEVFRILIVQVVWIVILFIVSRLLWNTATKRLTILGG